MADPHQVLAQRVHDAIVASFGPDFGDADPLIRPSSFADFQANVALPLGKRLGRPPREVAAELAARLDVADMCAEPEVSGPGFINFFLRDDWIAAQATHMPGDPDTMAIWQRLVDISRGYLHQVYTRLRVSLTDEDIRGESFYNDMLADTVGELEERGIAVLSEGALCAFPAGFTGREGRPLPLIIRKSDGGFNYASTDLAAVRYRVDKLSCDRSIYVVGSEQALHFQMIFAVAREAGWIPEDVSFE